MPDNKKGFTFDDFVNMGAQSQGSQFGVFGGSTPTAPLEPALPNYNQPPIEQPKQKEQLKQAPGVDMILGKGGELLFKDNGAKREVLNLIGAPSNAKKVEYRINRNLTEGQGKPYYDFIVVDSKGREIEYEAQSGETLGMLLSGIAKDEKDTEASFKRNRRVREKGGEWRPGYELPFEDGLIEVKKNTDWDRDLGDFAGRAFSNTFGTSSDMIIGGVQGGLRAASGLVGGRNNTMLGEALDSAADSDILTGGRELAQKAIRNQGFENEFANAASSGVGSVATIMGLPGVGLGVAALSAYESGVEKSRELAERSGEKSSNMADLAMGVGYGTVEFLMERMGGRAIKGAVNPSTARKLGQKMFDAAMEANPKLFSRFVSRVGDIGGAAAVNFIEEATTSLGQEVINDVIYDVDRDLYRTLKDAGMAGVGGAFGGGFARGGVAAAESAQGFSDRTRRSMVGESRFSGINENQDKDVNPLGYNDYSAPTDGEFIDESNNNRGRLLPQGDTPNRLVYEDASWRAPINYNNNEEFSQEPVDNSRPDRPSGQRSSIARMVDERRANSRRTGGYGQVDNSRETNDATARGDFSQRELDLASERNSARRNNRTPNPYIPDVIPQEQGYEPNFQRESPLDIPYEEVSSSLGTERQIPTRATDESSETGIVLSDRNRGTIATGQFTSPNVFSEQENYAITRLQRLGFTEADAIEEVKANRYGKKANTKSYQKLTQEFPESKPAVESLLSKAKKIYGKGASKVRSIFGSARQEMDASVDEQIAAAENITTPPVTPAQPQAPPVEPPVTESPMQEEAPITEEPIQPQDEFQEPSDLDLTDEELEALMREDEEPIIAEEAKIEDPIIGNNEQTVEEAPSTDKQFTPNETEDSTKASLLVDASNGLSDDDFGRLEVKGTTKSGGVYYKPSKGRAFEVAKIKDGKLVTTEAHLKNKAKIPSYNPTETTPNSTEGSQPGKRRRTKAQRAKDALEASKQSFTQAIDEAIEGSAGVSLVPGISASTLLKVIRAAGIKMNNLAIKALDEYINTEAQAVVNGISTLEQAVENIKAFIKDKFTKDTQISIDNEIAELVNATVEDIPKRAERERKKAEGKAKYEENMSKAEKNKAAKEVKTKASTVVKNLVKRANKGEYKGYNEITILESILKLDERLGVSKAYLRQAFNDAVAELRNPTTTNIGRATVVDARNYVKKYANALLESKKNDLIKNKLVTQILNGLDKINSYASVMQQLEVINKIMTKSNYANRLREAQRELAKAINARKSTPGLSRIVGMMGVTIKLSPVQDLETLEKLIDVAKKIAETRTPSEGLLKEFSAIYSSLKQPIPDTKETKERESKEKTGPSSKDIEDMKDSAINAIKRILSIRNNIIPDAIESLLGKDIAGDTFKLFDAIKVYKTDSLEDINAIYEFFNNTFNVYESSVKGTGISFNEHLLSEFAKADGYKATNAILKIQARAAEAEMIENNVDKVIDGVAKLFDYKNKTLAGRLLIGKWLGENKRRNFQQTISRLVNYSSDAAYAIENAVRIPLMQAFTKAEYRAQEILHKISKEIEKSDLDKSSYIHFQVLGMTLDYLNGNQKSHSFAAFLSNAVDIRKKIQNGLYDKSTKNNNDAKEALAWFDKHIGKISEDLSDISGPIANKIKELDGKPINREADYKAFTKIALPSKAWDLFSQNFFENFKSLGAEVRAVSMIYKGEQPDERPFYWPRKAIGRIDENRVEKPVNKTGEDVEEVDASVSIENFDDYDDYARKIETILNSGLDGAKFGQISSRTNPHSLARTQNKNLVYSLNAFDVASSFFTKATADTHATPELLKINKILGSESRRIFKQEGANALRDAVVLIARSQYNVGYKRLSNPLLKGVDPIVSEASRQMLGSYFQLYKQAIPPIKSYLLAGEGDIVKRFLALRSVIGDKENLSILGSIMSWRVTSAKEKLKNKYRRIGETSGLDFGVSRSNAVIDSFRELSAQQGGGNWIETLGDNIEKSKFLPMAFMVRQSRVSSEYLPTADSYARLVIYAAEIERRSGVKFEQFMTRRKFTAEDKKIVALADKQVNTIMGASFSKERSASLTMTSNSEYENLWKKMNYFMANALAQNSTVFRDSLQAAILDPANRAEHAKRAGLIAANAMIFLGINAGLGAGLAKIADLIGTAIFGEEEEEEEKDSIARSLTGGIAGVVKDLFFGNMGNLFNVFVTLGINLSDYTFKKATQMSDQERLKLVLDAVREHEQKGTSNEKLIERLQGIKEEARISERTLLYQDSKSYGKTAYIRPIVDMAGQYKGIINTPLDVIDLMYKEYDTEKGVTQKDMTKLYGSLLRQAPFLQADAVRTTQLGLKEIGKERKEDVKKPNRR